jgi:hypothetical protein
MQSERRITYLKIAAGAVVGLFVLDSMIISPAIAGWKEQSERLASIRQKVQRGRTLMERERSLRDRWAEMQRTDLPDDSSAAENEVFKAIGKWASESRVNFTSLTPQWRSHEEGYDTFEFRASAVGDQNSLGKLLYEVETDALPARIEECELTSRDNQGQQVGLTLKFSFVRITDGGRAGR